MNVNVPGRVSRVDAAKYEAMKRAILEVVPARESGLSAAEMVTRVAPLLPADLWPNGEDGRMLAEDRATRSGASGTARTRNRGQAVAVAPERHPGQYLSGSAQSLSRLRGCSPDELCATYD